MIEPILSFNSGVVIKEKFSKITKEFLLSRLHETEHKEDLQKLMSGLTKGLKT